ncbi:MAG: F0F1 ATP synthase subunit delta [Streptosporangiales bacterium]
MSAGLRSRSLDTAREQAAQVLEQANVDAGVLSQELFGLVDLFEQEHSVRRVVADPAVDAERKTGFLRALLADRVNEVTVDVACAIAGLRWWAPRSLVDAVEVVAVDCEVTAAEQVGGLDELEDGLFRFGRIASAQPELRGALSDPALPDERKRELLDELLQDKVGPSTLRLVTAAVVYPRRRSFADVLSYYGSIAAEHQRRLVALVRAAVPLTEHERERLQAALRSHYGQDVHLNVEIDPEVIGGLSVVIGSDLIEGTIARRFDEARRRLAG